MIIELKYPVRHKRKVPFSPVVNIDEETARLNREIFLLEAELDTFILKKEDYFELIEEAFSSNIHISTALEGNPLSVLEVRTITADTLRRKKPEKKPSFPVQEIINHIKAYMSDELITFKTDDEIKNIHKELMLEDSESIPGKYRTHRAVIQSGTGQELFIPAPPEHIKTELQSLIGWLNKEGMAYYPVVTGAIFFHEFESIHPFTDGNGRTGRTLFHLFLQRNSLPNSKLCFIEKYVVFNPEKYYKILAKTDYTGSYDELITYFTKAVHQSYLEVKERLSRKDLMSSELDEISKRCMIMAKREKNWFSLNTARSWFDNASDFQIRKRLTELVDNGILRTKGETRKKQYCFINPGEELKTLFK